MTSGRRAAAAVKGGRGSERRGLRSFGHGEFLKAQIVSDLQKSGQRVAAAEMEAEGAEALVQPTDDVEDERRLGDRLAEVPKVFSHTFEAATIFDDRQIALGEGAELLVGVEGACDSIPKELGVDGEPDGASRSPALTDDVGEVVGDGADQPGANDAIHPHPGLRGRRDGVGEDVRLQGVLAEDVEEGLLPASVEGGIDVEEQGNQSTDVLDQHRLCM